MSEQTSGALRAWFKRVEPLYPELFNTAHAICGNYELAEYALRSAILEVWLQSGEGGMGFREKLRGALLEESLRAVREDTEDREMTWPGFSDAGDDALLRLVDREPVETQRLIMLRHGLGLSIGRIADITESVPRQVRSTLNRFEVRCRRKLSAHQRTRFAATLTSASRRQLSNRTGLPHPATVYRAFEAEASNLQVSEHRVTRIVYHTLVFLMLLLCAALFWLFTVLVQPPAMEGQGEAPGAVVETVDSMS